MFVSKLYLFKFITTSLFLLAYTLENSTEFEKEDEDYDNSTFVQSTTDGHKEDTNTTTEILKERICYVCNGSQTSNCFNLDIYRDMDMLKTCDAADRKCAKMVVVNNYTGAMICRRFCTNSEKCTPSQKYFIVMFCGTCKTDHCNSSGRNDICLKYLFVIVMFIYYLLNGDADTYKYAVKFLGFARCAI